MLDSNRAPRERLAEVAALVNRLAKRTFAKTRRSLGKSSSDRVKADRRRSRGARAVRYTRSTAGDPSVGRFGCNEPGLGRTIEHAASGRIRDAGGRQGVDDHERDEERQHAAVLHATSSAAVIRPAEAATTSQARPTTPTSCRGQTAATRCGRGTAKNRTGATVRRGSERGHPSHTSLEQRLSDRQEREDRPDRRTSRVPRGSQIVAVRRAVRRDNGNTNSFTLKVAWEH